VAGPDLHMTAVQAPGAALTGGTVTIHHTVEAAPTGGSAGWFEVALYLSPDPVITTSDVWLANVPVSALASGASLSADTPVVIPATIAGGTWYVGAIADSRGAVLETDETDNALAGNTITVTAPDLILTSASAPATGVTGGVLTVPNTVVASATGGGAPAFHVGVFLSADPVITASDTLIGSREVGPMAPGATSTDATVATLPTNLPAGTYYIGVIADDFVMTICDFVNDFCTSTVDVAKEPDETNNVYLAGAITVTGPDLTVDAVSADGTAYTGRPLTVHDTVRATGGGTGPFAVAYYLSSDAVITTSDVLLGRRTVVALGPDQTSTADTTLTVPLGLAPGSYFIGAVVDSYDGVLESIEGNNALAGNAVAVIGPDLRATAVSGPASVNAGTTVPVTFTVAAAAGLGDAGALRVGLYLSQDQVITSTDQRLGEAYVAGVAAGASATSTVQVTIPGYLAPGTWYLGAIADSWRQYAEPDETDNAVAGNAVAITPPDLVAVAVSGPSAARTGETVSISSTLTAAPTGAIASGVTFSFYLSSDATITTGDRYVGGRWLSSLASGETSTADVTVTIPLDVPGGTWYLGAIADPSGSVPESDETNNVVVGGTVAVAAPDLIASAVTGPASGVAGSTIVIDDLVGAAVGGGAAGEFYVGLYLSADPVITPSDTLVGTRWVSGLQPGAASSGSTAVTLPASLPAGTYYLGVIADDFPMYVGDALDGYWVENAVLEPDESNNALAGPPITITRP
jgi:large repetitive protein